MEEGGRGGAWCMTMSVPVSAMNSGEVGDGGAAVGLALPAVLRSWMHFSR